MLELMKELGFIPESRAVRLFKRGEKVFGDRYDRVSYLSEKFSGIEMVGEGPVYVEATRFMSLVPYARKIVQREDYLSVYLRNGAEYKLPYLDIEFEREGSQEEGVVLMTGNLDISALKKTALQNLVKPEMRCIYVDGRGAVSCNFLQGTVDTSIKTVTGEAILLSPDITSYMTNVEGAEILRKGDTLLFTDHENVFVWAPVSEFDELEEGDEGWYNTIYKGATQVQGEFMEIPEGMEGAIKRLSYFSDEITFESDKIVSGENFEPISVPSAQGSSFTIEEVLSVLSEGKEILFERGALFLRNGDVTVMVSEKEDD